MKINPSTGRPVGDDHHRTRIPDAVVREMRDCYELRKWTMNQVRLEFSTRLGWELSFHTVRDILRYVRRNTL